MNHVYLVMENVKGGDLHQYMQNYVISEIQCQKVMFQLFQLLQYLGTHGIVHRDIKPNNILLETDLETKEIINIKLADFGLSKTI